MNNPGNGRTALRAMALLGGVLMGANAATAAVEISAKPTSNMACTGGVCSPTAKKAVLNVGDLEAMLASGDTTISSGAQAQDIELDATLRWSSAQTLTLDANRSIFFNKALLVEGLGSLTIKTSDGGSGGDYRFLGKGHAEFQNIDRDFNTLTINGAQFGLVNSMAGLHRAYARGGSNVALARSFNAGGVFQDSPVPSWTRGTIEGLGNTISNFSLQMGARRKPGSRQSFGPGRGFIGELGFGSTVRDFKLSNVNVSVAVQEQLVGGLVGRSGGTIKYSDVDGGSVVASGPHAYAGGLVGGTGGTVLGSFSNVLVSGSAAVFGVGGLVGVQDGSSGSGFSGGFMDQCYAIGSVSGGDGAMTGGLVGENLGGSLTNSYSTGATSAATNAFVGGLVGANLDNPQEGGHPLVQASYSSGTVSGGASTSVGGLIGEDTAPPAIANTYWDLDTSGIGDPGKGAGNIANDPGITGLTDAQLKSALPVGFDRKVWAQKAGINNGLPYLLANPPPK